MHFVSQTGSVHLPSHSPLQRTFAPHSMPPCASTLQRPRHLPLQAAEHLPLLFGSFAVREPSAFTQVPWHSPTQVDSHWPMQLAATSAVPSQCADSLHLPSQTTLSCPG